MCCLVMLIFIYCFGNLVWSLFKFVLVVIVVVILIILGLFFVSFIKVWVKILEYLGGFGLFVGRVLFVVKLNGFWVW